MLEWIVQGGGACPISGNLSGQVGWHSEQPDLVKDIPVHSRGVELDNV